jgi:hemolysin activation/secretion protein
MGYGRACRGRECVVLAALLNLLIFVSATSAPVHSESVVEAAKPTTVPPETARTSTSESTDNYFDIGEFRVLGNTVLPVIDIERAVYRFAGPRKTIQDVQAARGALEAAYHDAGFGTVFVDIPEQDVSQGIVRLRITEGRVDRVHVSGIRYFSARKMLAELPAVKPGEVPRLPMLQAELAAIGAESADRSVTPVLTAGRTPGTVDVELRVNDSLPLHGGITLNDRYTPDTSKLRSILDLSYGNLFQDFQNIAFEYQTAPIDPADERVLSLTYVAPLWFGHNLLAAYAIDTDSNVAAVGSLSLLGVGQVYGLHLIHPLPVLGTLSQNINFGGDFKDFSQTVNVIGQPPDKTPIRYINWSLTYSLSDHTERHDTSLSLGANFGIRGLVNDSAEFDYKRFGAQADYVYLRGNVERRDSLPWFGMSSDVRLGYQVADGPLVSNEQFGVGGVDTVRGYIESIELGDYAVVVQVELRGPVWTFGGDPLNNHIGAFAFYDAGVASITKPLPQQQTSFDLESVGTGIRLVAFRGLDGSLNWAYPLRTVSTVVRGHSRVEFQLHYGF